MNHHPHDTQWIEQRLLNLPDDYTDAVREQYSHLYSTQGRRAANLMLLDLPIIPIAYHEPHHKAAYDCHVIATLYGLEAAAEWASRQNVNVPLFPKDEASVKRTAALARLRSPDWWERQITKRNQRQQEAERRIKGLVGGSHPYVSEFVLAAYLESQHNQLAWRKRTVLISEDGDEISLDPDEHKHSQEFVKFSKYMVRVKGMEAMAEADYIDAAVLDALPHKVTFGEGGSEQDLPVLDSLQDVAGLVGIAVTLTVPSRFHRYKWDEKNKQWRNNPKFDAGTTPRDAAAWLQETWKGVQDVWDNHTTQHDAVDFFGYRVLESHNDGCPHYHFALWLPAQDAKRALSTFYDKALRGDNTDRNAPNKYCKHGKAKDATERGASKRRLNFKIIKQGGGMTAYMLKYISKGITGHSMTDLHSDLDNQDALKRILASRSCWGVRQFSFFGGAPIGVFDELLRFDDSLPCPEGMPSEQWALLMQLAAAAKARDWVTFVKLNGGMQCKRSERPVQTLRDVQVDDSGDLPVNDEGVVLDCYGEPRRTMIGLTVNGYGLQTRCKRWAVLDTGNLQEILTRQYITHTDTPRADLPAQFNDDLHNVIQQAKQSGQVQKLTDKAGVNLFVGNPCPSLVHQQAASSECDLSHLGLVGLTSLKNLQPVESGRATQ